MRWIIYVLLALSYVVTIDARLERAKFMPPQTTVDQVALWLPLMGLGILIILGFRSTTKTLDYWLIALALMLSAGCLMLALVPAIQ